MNYGVVVLALCVAAASAIPPRGQSLVGRQLKSNERKLGNARLGMYGGTSSTIEKHPYMVKIYGDGYFWCAGTIVSESWVVTTGMCTTLADDDASRLTVEAGTNGTKGAGTTYAVSQVVRHPNFNEDTYDYSYSCVQVDGTFTWSDTMQPLYLPSKNPSTYTWLNVAGWGAVDADSDSYNVLMEGTMKWMPKLYCDIIYAITGSFLTDRMGCAYNKKKTTLCTGDIGDAFTVDNVFYGQFIFPYTGDDICTSSSNAGLVAKIYPVASWIKDTTGATYA